MEGSIAEHFRDLDDPRRGQGKRHGLLEIITITILGAICGADEWTEIEDMARAKIEWLEQFLDLPHGIPSHDTLGRLFARLDPRQFERCLTDWITHPAGLAESDLIAIDGKTLRRSYDPAEARPPSTWSAPGAGPSASCWGNWPPTRKATKSRPFPNC